MPSTPSPSDKRARAPWSWRTRIWAWPLLFSATIGVQVGTAWCVARWLHISWVDAGILQTCALSALLTAAVVAWAIRRVIRTYRAGSGHEPPDYPRS